MGGSGSSSQNMPRNVERSERSERSEGSSFLLEQNVEDNLQAQQQSLLQYQRQPCANVRRNERKPTATQPVTQTKTIRNLVNLRKDTIELNRDTQETCHHAQLTFIQWRKKLQVLITSIQNSNSLFSFYVDLNKYPQPLGYTFQQGLEQQFPIGVYQINLKMFKENELENVDNYNFKYPIVIEMVYFLIQKTNAVSNDDQAHTQLTYGYFKRESGELVIKPFLQKILLNNEKTYQICEIYGCQQTIHQMANKQTKLEEYELNIGKECVICFTEQKDTAVLPCRHMCLCADCANVLRNQANAKCPICRNSIESLFQIKISNKKEEKRNKEKKERQRKEKSSDQQDSASKGKIKKMQEAEDSII